MSRRKQAAPCKVEGDGQSGNDALDAGVGKTTPKTVLMSDGINIGSSIHQNGEASTLTVAENGPLPNIENGSSSFLQMSGENASIMMRDIESALDESDASKIKQRFSARIRAKSLSNATKHAVEFKDEQVSIVQDADDPVALMDDSPREMIVPQRYRSISGEEELTCHICYKTFMSKYGLLTHMEVHSTSEFKCVPCCIFFPNRSQFVAHQLNAHMDSIADISVHPQSPATIRCGRQKQTENVFSGFSDLSFVDFTCSRFATIAAKWCEKIKHQLSNRDCRHFFLCKRCNILVPTLSSLQLHVKQLHPVSKQASLPFVKAAAGSTSLKNGAADGGAGDESHSGSIGNSVKVISCRSVTLDPMMMRPYMSALGLTSSSAKGAAASVVDGVDDVVTYGTDDVMIRTSAHVAYMNVPHWLRNNDKQINVNVSVEEDARPVVAPKDESTSLSCNTCGEKFATPDAVETHRASTMCGIGVKSSGNGRKMFWCRLCDYASFEKSTILRHQRTHTGIRPYACKLCRLAFTTKANCERHVRKRHASFVTTELAVKESVLCNHELLKKVRAGELNFSQVASKEQSPPRTQAISFQCRLCKAGFSSRSNSVRHVMSRHGILNRKGANDMVAFVRHHPHASNRALADNTIAWTSNDEDGSDPKMDDHSASDVPPRIGVKRSRVDGPGDGSSPYPVKVPRLIPLTMIKAYNETAEKLYAHFQSKYQTLIDSLGLTDTEQPVDLRRASFTLLGLLASTCSLMVEQSKPAGEMTSSAAGIDTSLSGRARGVRTAGGRPGLTVMQARKPQLAQGKVFRPIGVRPANDLTEPQPFTWKQRTLGIDGATSSSGSSTQQDLVQMFVDGRLKVDGNNSANQFAQNENSETSQVPVKVVSVNFEKHDVDDDASLPSSSTSQSGQSDWTSVKQLVDFVQHSLPIGVSGEVGRANSTPPMNQGANSSILSNEVPHVSRGKYKMIPIRPKQSEPNVATNPSTNQRLMWKFIPESPKTRDANGRFTRDPEAPSQAPSDPTESVACIPDDDRPTMVSMNGGARATFGARQGAKSDFRGHFMLPRNRFKSRKCMKCDKVFPWASSLRRHIMTHTGLKPYMCGHCEMRFTTRSNLLRHANRRHGAIRDASELRRVLVTLTPREQEEHAEKEAQKLADQDDNIHNDTAAPPAPMEQQSTIDVTSRYGRTRRFKRPFKISRPEAPTRRFMCGLCAIPFANRSNVVRHLHRIHNICKDDPNFRELLVKMDIRPRQNQGHESASVPSGVSEAQVALPTAEATVAPVVPVVEVVKTEAPLPQKYKPFQCGICAIGFTKRNNAARHVQQQHHISRKKANFSQLIIRVPPPSGEAPVVRAPVEKPVVPAEEIPVVTAVVEVPKEVTVKEEAPMEVAQPEPEPEKPAVLAKPAEPELPASSLGRGRRYSVRLKQGDEETTSPAPPPDESEGQKMKVVPRNTKKFKSTHFVCGVCKRIYNDIVELKEHLDTHNIPHPWHCPMCGVPFTNKYNCQRHLIRRHNAADVPPKYVEDLKEYKGPKRKKSRYYGR